MADQELDADHYLEASQKVISTIAWEISVVSTVLSGDEEHVHCD